MLDDKYKSSYNAIGNSKNNYQGNRKKVLTVCSAGILRSPTAAHVLNQKYGYNTRSCGLEHTYALTPITEALIYWADEIVCMDDYMKEEITEIIEAMEGRHQGECMNTEIKVLDIDDCYAYMDEDLQTQILEKYHVN